MTIIASSRKKYSISRGSWIDFPRGPTTDPNQPMIDPSQMTRQDGSVQQGLYSEMNLQWEVMTFNEWLALNAMYDYNHTSILLNYLGVGNASGLPQWYYAPAVMSHPPTGKTKGSLVFGVELKLTQVEWFLPYT